MWPDGCRDEDPITSGAGWAREGNEACWVEPEPPVFKENQNIVSGGCLGEMRRPFFLARTAAFWRCMFVHECVPQIWSTHVHTCTSVTTWETKKKKKDDEQFCVGGGSAKQSNFGILGASQTHFNSSKCLNKCRCSCYECLCQQNNLKLLRAVIDCFWDAILHNSRYFQSILVFFWAYNIMQALIICRQLWPVITERYLYLVKIVPLKLSPLSVTAILLLSHYASVGGAPEAYGSRHVCVYVFVCVCV